jgi:hypothetical protein
MEDIISGLTVQRHWKPAVINKVRVLGGKEKSRKIKEYLIKISSAMAGIKLFRNISPVEKFTKLLTVKGNERKEFLSWIH